MSDYFNLINKIRDEVYTENPQHIRNIEKKFSENLIEKYEGDKIYYFGQNKAIVIKKNEKKKEAEVICLEM
tara:strand:- start:252 stop:464 length:213 start_codon:yes stop_codon:yes gene_type:complete